MAITGSLNTRAGSGTISLTHGSLGSQTMQIADVGVIDIDYDFQDEYSNDMTGLYFGPSELTLQVFDKLSDGSSLFEDLDAIASTQDVILELSFTTDGGYSWEGYYEFTKNDIKYRREERSVEITAKSDGQANAGVTIDDVFSGMTTETQGDGWNVGTSIVLPDDFIQEYSNSLPAISFGQSRTVVNQTASFQFTSAQHKTNGFESIIIEDVFGTDPATDLIFRMAAFDGSIVGNILGYFFMVNRLSTTLSASISEDDISSLELDPGLENFRRTQITHTSFIGSSSNLLIEQHLPGNSDMNRAGTKQLRIYIKADQLARVVWDGTNSEFDVVTGRVSEGISADVVEGQVVIPVNNASTFTADRMCILQHVSSSGDFVAESTFHPRDAYRITNVDTGSNEITLSEPVVRDYPDSAPYGPTVYASEASIFSPSALEYALQGYEAAYGATGGKRIKVELFDIDLVDPFDALIFDSSNIDAIQGLTFRPSKMSYNLIKDTIEIEAYEIG